MSSGSEPSSLDVIVGLQLMLNLAERLDWPYSLTSGFRKLDTPNISARCTYLAPERLPRERAA